MLDPPNEDRFGLWGCSAYGAGDERPENRLLGCPLCIECTSVGGTVDEVGPLPYPLLLLTMLELLLLELFDADAVAGAGVLVTTAFCSVESSELLLPYDEFWWLRWCCWGW